MGSNPAAGFPTRRETLCRDCGATWRLEVHHKQPLGKGGQPFDLAGLDGVVPSLPFEATRTRQTTHKPTAQAVETIPAEAVQHGDDQHDASTESCNLNNREAARACKRDCSQKTPASLEEKERADLEKQDQTACRKLRANCGPRSLPRLPSPSRKGPRSRYGGVEHEEGDKVAAGAVPGSASGPSWGPFVRECNRAAASSKGRRPSCEPQPLAKGPRRSRGKCCCTRPSGTQAARADATAGRYPGSGGRDLQTVPGPPSWREFLPGASRPGSGVDFPSVAVGDAVYPVLLTGTSASHARAQKGSRQRLRARFTGFTLEPDTADGLVRISRRRCGPAACLGGYVAEGPCSRDDGCNGQSGCQRRRHRRPPLPAFSAELPAVDDPTDVTTWDSLSLKLFAGEGRRAQRVRAGRPSRAARGRQLPISWRRCFPPLANVTQPAGKRPLSTSGQRIGGLSASEPHTGSRETTTSKPGLSL